MFCECCKQKREEVYANMEIEYGGFYLEFPRTYNMCESCIKELEEELRQLVLKFR